MCPKVQVTFQAFLRFACLIIRMIIVPGLNVLRTLSTISKQELKRQTVNAKIKQNSEKSLVMHIPPCGYVTFKADIAALWFWSDVYGHVFSQAAVFMFLYSKFCKRFSFKMISESYRLTFCRTPFIEYPQGSNRQSSIFMCGKSLSIPDFCSELTLMSVYRPLKIEN